MQIEVKSGQSVWDLAIMFGYGVEQVALFCNSTGIKSIESSLENKILIVTKIDNNLSNFINLQKLTLCTELAGNIDEFALLTDDGIEITTDDGDGLLID